MQTLADLKLLGVAAPATVVPRAVRAAASRRPAAPTIAAPAVSDVTREPRAETVERWCTSSVEDAAAQARVHRGERIYYSDGYVLAKRGGGIEYCGEQVAREHRKVRGLGVETRGGCEVRDMAEFSWR